MVESMQGFLRMGEEPVSVVARIRQGLSAWVSMSSEDRACDALKGPVGQSSQVAGSVERPATHVCQAGAAF